MRIQSSRPATALAIAAAFCLTASPVFADGWGRHRHHRGGVDAGDVIAGVLILGGIAAIASAASKNSRARDSRYPDDRYPESREPDPRRDEGAGYRGTPDRGTDYSAGDYGARGRDGQGLGEAVDSCVAEIERGNSDVDGIDAVRRNGEGWTVEGRTRGGRDFECSVGPDGQVRSAAVDGRPA